MLRLPIILFKNLILKIKWIHHHYAQNVWSLSDGKQIVTMGLLNQNNFIIFLNKYFIKSLNIFVTSRKKTKLSYSFKQHSSFKSYSTYRNQYKGAIGIICYEAA